MTREIRAKAESWVRKHIAEPQMEIFDRAAKLIETKQNGYTCIALGKITLESFRHEIGGSGSDHDTYRTHYIPVDDLYLAQWRSMWRANNSDVAFWWNRNSSSAVPYTRGQKVRAMHFFKKLCLEGKIEEYKPKNDIDNIKEWILIMYSKDKDLLPNEITRAMVSNAIKQMQRIKTGITLTPVNSHTIKYITAELNKE
jgi:hypothetical protein